MTKTYTDNQEMFIRADEVRDTMGVSRAYTITHLRSCIGQVCGWVKCWLCDWAILISII